MGDVLNFKCKQHRYLTDFTSKMNVRALERKRESYRRKMLSRDQI